MPENSKYKLYQIYTSTDNINWTPTDRYEADLLEECTKECGCTKCLLNITNLGGQNYNITLSDDKIPNYLNSVYIDKDNAYYELSTYESCNPNLAFTDVVINECTTNIGKYAFAANHKLSSVTIPDSVTTIGDYAFWDGRSITSFTIPESVIEIGENAFLSNGNIYLIWNSPLNLTTDTYQTNLSTLSNIVIGNLTKEIGDWTFGWKSSHIIGDLSSIREVKFGNAIERIGSYAFDSASLEHIELPDSLKIIDNSAFEHNFNLTSVTFGNSIEQIGAKAFLNCPITGTLSIPRTVKSIGDKAFFETNISELVLPKNANEISFGEYCFANNKKLKKINFGGLTSLPSSFIDGCSGLTEVSLPNIKEIGTGAFTNCINLSSITVTNNLTTIGDWAFNSLSALTSFNMPNSVTSIGTAAFFECDSLNSLTISNQITSIPSGMCEYCNSLSFIELPESVSNIGASAFWNCRNLQTVVLKYDGVVYFSGIDVFGTAKDSLKIFVPETYIEQYRTKYPYYYDNFQANNIEIKDGCLIDDGCLVGFAYAKPNVVVPEGVTCIKEEVAMNNSIITSIVLPSTIQSVGYDAFRNCYNLTSVTLTNGIKEIGRQMFAELPNITELIIPNSVTNIGIGTFAMGNPVKYQTNKWQHIKVGSGVSIIPEGMFSRTNVAVVDLPNTITSISRYAFEGCNDTVINYNGTVCEFNNIEIIGNFPDSIIVHCTDGDYPNTTRIVYIDGSEIVTTITDPDKFENRSNIKELYYGQCSITSIAKSAFSGYTNLTTITIPNSVTSIGNGAFENCNALTSITIPDSVTKLERNAFSNCTSLISANIGSGLLPYSDIVTTRQPLTSVFVNCTSLQNVIIKKGITSIGNYAFQNCTSLTSITYTGTKSEWNAITKSSSWNLDVPATVVHCTDGDVSI